MVDSWTDVSDLNTGVIIYLCYNVCPHRLHLTVHYYCSTSSIWQTSHTQAQNAHTGTQTLASRCQGRLSPCLTQCYFQVGVGFPFFGCGILQEQETTLYGGKFLMAPIRHRNSDSLILLTICACRRISHGTWYRALQGYVPPWGSFSNHTLGVKRLSSPGRAGLCERLKGKFS